MLKRLGLYFAEMYPPLPALLIAFVSFFNVYFMLALIHGQKPMLTFPALGGASTLFLFLLFLRISDEFKDYEVDRVLFPERLVPSGRVQLNDLKILMIVVIGLMWLLNLSVTGAFWAFAILFGYGFLMFHYFFLRRWIAPSLVLALLTHNPSVLLMNGYVVFLFCQEHHFHWAQWGHLYVAIVAYLPGLAWELGRKIRAPQDETDYMTYSRLWGYAAAALAPPAVMGVQAGLLLGLRDTLMLPLWFQFALVLALIVMVFFYSRFRQFPNAQTARLKPVTEAYMLVSALGLCLALLTTHGMSFRL